MKRAIYALALFGIACRVIFTVVFSFAVLMTIIMWLARLDGPIAEITANIVVASPLPFLINGLYYLIVPNPIVIPYLAWFLLITCSIGLILGIRDVIKGRNGWRVDGVRSARYRRKEKPLP